MLTISYKTNILITLDLDFADIRAYPPGRYHQKPFSDPRVRQAISLAIDRQGLVPTRVVAAKRN
jgi:ABC-type transport system substrate-binding protein